METKVDASALACTCATDDMGLGKTVQTIAFIAAVLGKEGSYQVRASSATDDSATCVPMSGLAHLATGVTHEPLNDWSDGWADGMSCGNVLHGTRMRSS